MSKNDKRKVVDPGNPYAALTYPVKVEPCPYDDPHYDPKGEPPDGHQIALNKLAAQKGAKR